MAVALDGDVAVVGSGGMTGTTNAAYVFRRVGGVWTQEAVLTGDGGAMPTAFGSAVAVDGDTVVVGAKRTDEWRGAVYVFVRGSSAWTCQAKLQASDGVYGDGANFGESVAIDGDRLAVGAGGATAGGHGLQGAVYVFTRKFTDWAERDRLSPADGAEGDLFGRSVALQGDLLVGGAPGDDVGGVEGTGSVRPFRWTGTAWNDDGTLAAPGASAFDALGSSVALDGDTVVAGAPNTMAGGQPSSGAAHVFVYAGGAWDHQAQLTAPSPADGEQFGSTLGVSADTAVVGTVDHTVGGNEAQGGAFVFVRSGGTWSEFRTLELADGAAYDNFGTSIAIDGRTVIAGAPGRQVGGNAMQGAGYAYDLPPVLWSLVPAWASTLGGTPVTAEGHHFVPGSVVTLDGVPLDDPVLEGESRLTGVAPAHAAGTVAAVVTNPDGTAATWAGTFRYARPPSVSSAQPDRGPLTGGGTVTILGSGFDGSEDVAFDGLPAAVVLRPDPELIVVAPPAHAAGVVDVTVTSTTTGLSGVAHGAYIYVPPPTVTLVTPDRGSTLGNAPVTITGTGFQGPATVTFGGSAATSVVVINDTVIHARTPAHAAGTVPVRVENADGQQGSLDAAYTFTTEVVITSISPTTFDAGEVSTLTIHGMGFNATETLLVGGASASATGADPTQLTAQLPPHGAGTFAVGIWRPDQPLWVPAGQSVVFRPKPGHEGQELVDPAYGANDAFGASVALAGDRLFVGDPGSAFDDPRAPGRVCVYVRTGDAWSHETMLTPSDSASGDRFGAALASSGDRLVVGAPGHAGGGAAYVFDWNGTWTQTSRLTAASQAVQHRFGTGVALSGDRVAVSAPTSESFPLSFLAIFASAPGGWQQEAALDAPWGNNFDAGIALDGDVVAAGLETLASERVLVFTRTDGVWSEAAPVLAPDVVAGTDAEFGHAVALSDGRLLVGAPRADNGLTQTGMGFLFDRAGSSWTLGATFAPRDPDLEKSFGSSVAMSGGTVAIGGALSWHGIAYVFRGPGPGASGAWVETGRLHGSYLNPRAPASLAVAPGTVAFGRERACYAPTPDVENGCVQIYEEQPAVLDITPDVGPVAGGTTLTVTGTYFADGSTVSFGGVPARSVSFVDARTLAVVTPAHGAGTVEVAITVPGHTPVVRANGFTFVTPPTIASVTPDHGMPLDWVTITGTGFDGPAVYFGESQVPPGDVSHAGSTSVQARATTPYYATGVVDITVVNPDGGRATARDAFRFDPPAGAPDTVLDPPDRVAFSTFRGFDVRGTLAVMGRVGSVNALTAGQAYAYRRSGGRWRLEEAFFAPDGRPLFGLDVVTDGSAFAVGSMTSAGGFETFVYEQVAGIWRCAARVGLPDVDGYHSLAMDDGVLAAGVSASAQVLLYGRQGADWARTQSLLPAAGHGEGFGRSVAVDGSWLAVGADASVSTFEHSGGAWAPRTVLPSPLTNGAVFGHTVALDATTLAVGVPGDNPSGADGRGAVYLFERNGSGWAQTVKLVAPDGAAGDHFGERLSLNGTWLAVQAPGVRNPGDRVGAVYLYQRRSGTWQLNGRVVPWDDLLPFDHDVALSDQELFVGLPIPALFPLPPVVVSGVHPPLGPTAGGTPITIVGQRFQAGTTVTIGGAAATDVTVIGPLALTARTPAHAPGAADIVVRHPNGLSGTLTGGYTYRDVDLVVSGLTAPAGLGAGDTATVVVSTKNAGPGAALASTTAVFLSRDAAVDDGDVVLDTHVVPALNAGRSSKRILTVTIPPGTAPGSYWVIAAADANADVGEKNEGNNARVKALTVGCDLLVSALTAPAPLRRGAKATLTVTTKNAGPGRAPASATRLYLSQDQTIGLGDTLLLTHAVGALAAAGTSKGTLAWTVPAGLTPGTYYLLARADAGAEVPERDETNNVKAKRVTVR